MRVAVLQSAIRADRDSQARSLAELRARAVAQGAEVLIAAPVGGESPLLDGIDLLGTVVVLEGDAAIDPVELAKARRERPAALVLMAGSESELQAEGVLELAIAASVSVASIVIVAEHGGGDIGAPGHGGSAIVVAGEVVAEAFGTEDLVLADVPVPAPPIDASAPDLEPPLILKQRLARHRGEKPETDYLADLS
ncbi:hypothetical protein MX659_06880 [Coriobacteriia bacterium Es71-Z0120]|uniref:hypothetical protein n=1 Tax=Parvivirga hydrogeniphila TaxID=2939460 RepID=UPI002260AEA6|nr:hypothetical protein [Parvivirga hydrogeniphila]MCL4079304.1 hypothetical protein [Parvivirga hydrogeniphila]